MAKHLEDIGKDAKDLLTESYPIDGTVKITSQIKVQSLGVTPKITFNRYIKREKGAAKEIVTAILEPKLEIKEHKLEITGKFTPANDITVGSSVRDVVVQGSKLELSVNRSDKDGITGVAGASFKNESVAVKGKLSYPLSPKNPTKISTEAVFHHSSSNSDLGLGVEVSLEEAAHIFPELVLAHSTSDTQYKGLIRFDFYKSSLNWGFSVLTKWSDKCKTVIDVYSEDNSNKMTYTSGAEYRADEFTTVKGKTKVIKNKDRFDYRVGASLKQKVSPYVLATFGADLNPRSFLGSTEGDLHSFGLEIKFQE